MPTREGTYHLLFDDAMISARYAWNWTHGAGLVWNKGEYIEGYTNPLQVALIALPMLALDKSDSLLAVQIMGVWWVLLGALLVAAIARRIWPSQWASLVGVGCVLLYYPLVYWSVGGMETGPLFGLLSLTLWLTLKIGADEVNGYAGSLALGSLFGLLYLCRPDGIIFAFPCLIFLHRYRSVVSTSLLLAGLIIGTHLLWRHGYYGAWLPNTYTLKMTGWPLVDRIEGGLGFVRAFIWQTWGFWPLSLVGVWRFRRPELILLASFLPLTTAYQIFVGGDPWPLWRIMAPTMPFTLLCAARALSDIEAPSRIFSRAVPAYAVSLVWVGLWCAYLYYVNAPFQSAWQLQDHAFDYDIERKNLEKSVILRHRLTPHDSIAVFCAGCVPYYTDYYAIDMLGKNDPYIAHLKPDLSGAISWAGMNSVPGHNKYDLNYSVGKLHPVWVEDLSWGRQKNNPQLMALYNTQIIDGIKFYFLKPRLRTHH